ncbi:ABC transporter permease [Microbacterium gorillae]|uniref:ABC transporter permease n=1 Tax=Microbacterium gorillae TaxID=1231063 RepID=UPI000AFE987A|nr:ABC transporter permease [Microbacterium gorillae]
MTPPSSRFGALSPSDFQIPGRSRGFLDVIRWHYLLTLLVRTGVTTRYRNSVLGWTWSYVRPAAQFIVFWLVLGVLLHQERGIPNFAVYLFSGIVIINLFSEAYKNGTTAIVGNAPLVRKVYLPRQLFAVSAVIVAFVHFLPQLALLLVVCAFLGWFTQITVLGILAILAAILLISFLALGLGLLFGAVNVRFRDAENIVELLLMLATWASPVLYHWTVLTEHLPSWAVRLYMLNPITQAVELFHYGFWYTVTDESLSDSPVIAANPVQPHLAIDTLWAFLICAVVFALGQIVFRRMEGRFAQEL